jgi:hypothetical protein
MKSAGGDAFLTAILQVILEIPNEPKVLKIDLAYVPTNFILSVAVYNKARKDHIFFVVKRKRNQ